MTKKELFSYIESFNKFPGTYDDEELYKIGVAHKTLLRSEKNWEELANVLGLNISGEQYRKIILRKQSQDGTLPKNINQLTEKTVFDVTGEEVLNKTHELFKQHQRIRDERNALYRHLRDESRIDALKDVMKDSIIKLNKLPSVTYRPTAIKTSTEAILMFSDLHLGVVVDSFYNKYNSVIAEKRVMKLVDDTIEYCKANKVKKLNFINLGDLVHGIIHISARIETEFDVMEQTMHAGEILARALNRIQEAAPEIVYRSSTDNHSRAVASKHESIEKENFGRLIDWYLEERLRNTKINFIKDNLDVDLGMFYLENGKIVTFSHGHRDTINLIYQSHQAAVREVSDKVINYMLIGHYHSEKAKSYQNTKVFVNGSIVGTEQYAHSKRLYSYAAQTLLVFDRENVINYSIDLNIRD
jgi:hypothetical protein